MEGFYGGGPWRGKIATPHDFYVPDRNKLNNNLGYVMIGPWMGSQEVYGWSLQRGSMEGVHGAVLWRASMEVWRGS